MLLRYKKYHLYVYDNEVGLDIAEMLDKKGYTKDLSSNLLFNYINDDLHKSQFHTNN